MAISLYSDLFFIYLLILSLLPAVILGLVGKNSKIYGMLIDDFMKLAKELQ